MDRFYNKIKKICEDNKRVAMFVDMDGTIVEYVVYPDSKLTTNAKGLFENNQPVEVVLENLKKINLIENIDLYILSLAKSNIIVGEKHEWLNKYADFFEEKNRIILNKELGEYSKENRDFVKAEKIMEMMDEYDYVILLDDDHKILKQAQECVGDRGCVFHLSSAVD